MAPSVDLVLREGNAGYDVLLKCQPPIGMKAVQSQERQQQGTSTSSTTTGGDTAKTTATTTISQQQKALVAKKQAKAMSIATSPAKNILMNAFMMYMSGKNLNIFSISITSGAILGPIRSILSLSQTFSSLEDGNVDLQMPKLVFVLLNLVWFGIGMYKMSQMRLLPTTSADWTGSVVWKEMMETTSIPPQ